MGTPEPWALVLAPILTSSGRSINWWVGELGGPTSFPVPRFRKVVPPSGLEGHPSVGSSCWVAWL